MAVITTTGIFEHELVKVYLKSMENASIDVLEIGFRSPPKASFMGPFLYIHLMNILVHYLYQKV